MITVRVIFLGLIGFVPSPEGFKDLAALLVDPVRAETQEMSCPAEAHIPFVFLLHGRCQDQEDCVRIGRHARGAAKMTGLRRAVRNKKPTGLLWMLRKEDVEISGDEDEELDIQERFLSFLPMNSPGSMGQTSYFSWVPRIARLVDGAAQLRNDCRRGSPTCPLHARFRIDGGSAGACHLFHDLEPVLGAKRNVRVFTYAIPGRMDFKQAVADAVMVEFKEKNMPYVTLRSQGLPGECRPRVSVDLTPDGDGRVTLIVGNLISPAAANHYARDSYGHPHSDVFFNLLTEQVARPVRTPVSEPRVVEPGACENEMVELTDLLAPGIEEAWNTPSFKEFPHAVTACDGISFPKPK